MRRAERRLTVTVAAASLLLALPGASEAQSSPAAREFTTPMLTFPTGIAVAVDGGVWIASTYADKLVRFDPESREVREVRLPLRSHPAGLLVDEGGAVWYAGSGLGVIGRLDPGHDRPREFAIPRIATARFATPSPWSLALDRSRSEIWFTVHSDGLIARVPVQARPVRRGFVVSEIELGDLRARPDGIAVDGRRGVWVAELGRDAMVRVVAATGELSRVEFARGSRPRGVAAGPEGAIWVTLFGTHELARLDPASLEIRRWPMPSGPRSHPWAVAVDRSDRVWVSEYEGNAVVRFDPATERFLSFPLPTPRSRVRALAVDAQGRVWFAGSGSGRLGVIE
jgi:virginiamycin B lyase